MQEKRKAAEYIIKKIHVKDINVIIKLGTYSLKIFADMETLTKFRQDYFAITKITINKGQTNTVKTLKGLLSILLV